MKGKEKTFKTIDEQIDILLEKGLIIDDIDYTKSILLRENYFFLMGYRHLFLKICRWNCANVPVYPETLPFPSAAFLYIVPVYLPGAFYQSKIEYRFLLYSSLPIQN